MDSKKKEALDDIQEVEYTPASEDDMAAGEAANPLNDVQSVQHAVTETPKEKVQRTSANLAMGMRNMAQGVAQGAKDYMARKKLQKMEQEAQQPQQPVRKFDRRTIQIYPQARDNPQSPVTQDMQSQFYRNESTESVPTGRSFMDRFGGDSGSVMDKFGGASPVMQRFGGSQNIMDRFNSPGKATSRGMGKSRAALTIMQKLNGMGASPKRGKPARGTVSTMQKFMGGGNSYLGGGKKKQMKWI